MLFLVYINDIVTYIGSNIRLFADDTSLYIIVDNPLVTADYPSKYVLQSIDFAFVMIANIVVSDEIKHHAVSSSICVFCGAFVLFLYCV